jgi:hypothetical protein
MFASNPVPHEGTDFNFTTRVGLGATHRLNHNTHLIGGARWFHLSNARIHGGDQNPSINGVEWHLGLAWQW